MGLPRLAAFPPPGVRSISGPSWDEALQLWMSMVDIWLASSEDEFVGNAIKDGNVLEFLKSFYGELFKAGKADSTLGSTHCKTLRMKAFLLAHRILSSERLRPESNVLLELDFLGPFAHAHLKQKSTVNLLDSLWISNQNDMLAMLKCIRSNLAATLESKDPDSAEQVLQMVAPLVHTLPPAAAFMAQGTELLDAMYVAYERGSIRLKSCLVPVAYLSLVSLTKYETMNLSALLDHLYGMKSQADANPKTPNLLSDLVTNTPLLGKLKDNQGKKTSERAHTLAATLQTYRQSAIARGRSRGHRSYTRAKGKGRAIVDLDGERHIHLMSKITQIQDLFPDLGSGFIARLLDAYDEDVETVTAHLLEDSLPAQLATMDRSRQLPSSQTSDPTDRTTIDTLIPSSTPPHETISNRRNIYDNDAFDRLEVSSTQYHIGRAHATRTADEVLADRTKAPQKAAILSALAAFDSDDDERDDTYDEADVGGTVDKAAPDGEGDAVADLGGDANEELLFRAWRADKSLFGRTQDVRRAKARDDLRRRTGMTDEAIEGWGIMLDRDGRRQKRLEGRYGFDGAQNVLQRTAFRDGGGGESGTDSDIGPGTGRGGFRGRGRGSGRGRGRGGNVAGEPSDAGTQAARHRKEANKGSRANHNRRDQRARKVARAGFPG